MDKNRRKFLAVIIAGVGSLVVVKILGPILAKFFDRRSIKNEATIFRVVKRHRRLSIYSHSGEEILEIDDKK